MNESDIRFLNALVAPTIFVIARPNVDWNAVATFEKQETEWWRDHNVSDADSVVELAGRMCYLSFGPRQSPRNNAEYIANLIAQGHESVLEHASWTFILTGVSRAFTHQLVRHRVGFSFSQLSQQYHTEEDARFIESSSITNDPRRRAVWRESVLRAQAAYLSLLSDDGAKTTPEGVPKSEARRSHRSAARSLLPAATETKIVVTANAPRSAIFCLSAAISKGMRRCEWYPRDCFKSSRMMRPPYSPTSLLIECWMVRRLSASKSADECVVDNAERRRRE